MCLLVLNMAAKLVLSVTIADICINVLIEGC